MSFLPNSYYEMLAHAASYSSCDQPKVVEVIKNLALQGMILHAQAPIFYVVDYSQKKYLYIDPSCEKLLGHDVSFLSEAGPLFFTSLWNQNDFKCFNEKIFPEVIDFLKSQSVSDYHDYSFSFNYRVKDSNGKYITVLQRSTYFSVSEQHRPIAAVGYIIDISNYKTDSSIIHTIEKVDRDTTSLSKMEVFKTIHYPDKVDSLLSTREIEILNAVHQGLGSKEIANRFCISLHTVNNHRKNMLFKTKTNNSNELVGYAKRHGLI